MIQREAGIKSEKRKGEVMDLKEKIEEAQWEACNDHIDGYSWEQRKNNVEERTDRILALIEQEQGEVVGWVPVDISNGKRDFGVPVKDREGAYTTNSYPIAEIHLLKSVPEQPSTHVPDINLLFENSTLKDEVRRHEQTIRDLQTDNGKLIVDKIILESRVGKQEQANPVHDDESSRHIGVLKRVADPNFIVHDFSEIREAARWALKKIRPKESVKKVKWHGYLIHDSFTGKIFPAANRICPEDSKFTVVREISGEEVAP
jgi:hypothetical protein